MKICMMTNTFLPHVGGVARSVDTFAEDLRRLGHEVIVAAPEFKEMDRVPERIERHVVRLPAVQEFNGSDFSVRLPFTVLNEPRLLEFKPDIVHSHHPYLIGDSAIRYACEMDAPMVFTHHTLYEQYTHYVPVNAVMLKNFVTQLCTSYTEFCDAVIAPSESIEALLKERGVIAPVRVIPTGVDVKSFSSGDGEVFRRRWGIPKEAFVAGHVGRLAKEKNLGFLAESVARFLETRQGARFVLVGSGPSEDEVMRIFDGHGQADKVTAVGNQAGEALCDAYAAMDCFVFSSQSETQGMVLAEAMAAGLPVVALDASGVREVVRDDHNGYLLDSAATEQEFAEAVSRIEREEQTRARLSRSAAETAGEFSREQSVQKLEELYRHVLRQKKWKLRGEKKNPWNDLINRIELEWALVGEKAEAAAKAMAAMTLK